MGGREFGAKTDGGIKREDVAPTLNYLSEIAKVDLIPLGSAGKKERSGDIDLAIDSNKVSPKEFEEVLSRLRNTLGQENYTHHVGLHIHSFAVPINGSRSNGYVQIDIKYNDANFLKFSHFSAEGERSAYKGAVRHLLLASVVASTFKAGHDIQVKEGDQVIAEARWGIDANDGLKRIYRMRKMRLRGGGRKKDMENVPASELHASFPDLEFDMSAETIRDPKKITQFIFGKGVKPEQIESAEEIIALLKKKRPELIEGGLFERVDRQLQKIGLTAPSEFNLPAKPDAPQSVVTDELASATLPAVELVKREFEKVENGKTKYWAIAIEAEGDSFKYWESLSDGTLRESNSVKIPATGKVGSRTYVEANIACEREVARRIQMRIKKGYRELGAISSEATKPAQSESEIDFTSPLPRNFRTPKPAQLISDKEFARLWNAGQARISRKYDGIGLNVVHHSWGWEIYTLQGNVLTQFFPNHVDALRQLSFGPGSILKAEAVVFIDANSREDCQLIAGAFNPNRDAQAVRSGVENGLVPEPAFVFYDILYENGRVLDQETYDQRSQKWLHLPIAGFNNGLLQSAELFSEINPDNWRQVRLEMGIEGFVINDANAVLGRKIVSFGSAAARPTGSYKLKPNMEEDVVAYAVRKVDGRYESLFLKQRYPDFYPDTVLPHPKAGEWFACGRVSTHFMKEVLEQVEIYVQAGKIQVVENNRTGEAIAYDNENGVTVVVEFFDRFPTNKFRHPVVARPVRFRSENSADYKPTSECIANYLGEKPFENEDDYPEDQKLEETA